MGGARSQLSYSTITNEGDTITAPRSSGGYALIDLGVKISPNRNTEILGMIRINNEFGGFWGGGVTFDVRQLHVRGVAGNIVRYQIGNIDYKLTPYTFYNHNSDFLFGSFGSNRIKQDIVDYESFYRENNWRQQGASASFALEFPKIINELTVNSFLTRLNPSNQSNILERLYGGGNVVIEQSKHLDLGLNYVSAFDVLGTALDSNKLANNVTTATYKLKSENDKFKFGLEGEAGMASLKMKLLPEQDLNDYFFNAQIFLNSKKQQLNFTVGVMDNGPDFRSFGAQSKRVNFNQENNFFNRYTNQQILRPISNFDLYNDPGLYNQGITIGLMDYHPIINMVLPYGVASFNRRGFHGGLSFVNKKKNLSIENKNYLLSEIRGQGTTYLRKFLMSQVNASLQIHKLIGLKKEFILNTGLVVQNSSREGDFEFELIDMNTIIGNTSIEYELVDKLSIFANGMLLSANGNDQIPVRDETGQIINYDPINVSGNEFNWSTGIKFNFTKKIYLAAFYESNQNRLMPELDYQLNQFSVIYMMKF